MLSTVVWHRDRAAPGYVEIEYDPEPWNGYAAHYAKQNKLMLSPLLPLMAFLSYSFFHVSGGTTYYDLTLLNYRRFFTDEIFLPVFWRTCLLCLEVSVLAIAFGYPVAFFLASLRGRKKYALLMLLLVPLLMSYIIKIYAIRSILGGTGFLNRTLLDLGIINAPLDWLLYNEGTTHVALVYVYTLFMTLPIYLSHRLVERPAFPAVRQVGLRQPGLPQDRDDRLRLRLRLGGGRRLPAHLRGRRRPGGPEALAPAQHRRLRALPRSASP